MRNTILIGIMVLCASLTMGQKKSLTLDEAVMQQRTTLAPKRLTNLQWIPGTDSYSFIETRNDVEAIIKRNASTNKEEVVATKHQINQYLKAASMDTIAKLTAVTWKSSQQYLLNNSKEQAVVTNNIASKSNPTNIPDKATLVEEGKRFTSYQKDYNLYVLNGSKEEQLTFDGTSNIVYGKSVHREEFGIEKGQFWSPQGNQLAFYRMDQQMVTDYPIVDFKAVPAVSNDVKYPFSGGASHHVSIGVWNSGTNKVNYLKTGLPADQYLTNIAWSNDEQFIYVAVVNREQNKMWLNKYNASSGEFINTLFNEEDAKYIEPLHPLEFLPNSNNQFIWQSKRDGFNHIYLYNESGSVIKQLTKGPWEVIDVLGFSKDGKELFFISTINGAINRDLCKVNIKTSQVKILTVGKGVHTITMNENFNYFIDQYSSLNVPRNISIVDHQGKYIKQIFSAENPLKNYNTGETKLFTIKSTLGDDLNCRMVMPVDFDSTKKYPVIVYVYGGPHIQLVTNTWLGGGELWYHYMANKGYIIFTSDNHGSGNRGKAFEQAVFRQLGTVEIDDQMKGVNYLTSLPYVDKSRIGVHGWSYGGFMTTSLLTRTKDVFKVGVAGGPVINWENYEVMYTERYMDTPQENKQGYEENNLLNRAKDLKSRLLMIHGTNDDVVVWQHSLKFLQKCIEAGNTNLDYFVYPGHLHNVTGKDRVHLMGKVLQYFEEHL